ncbi:MAG: hypothetical protein WBD40_15510 [Tepidisphaeraceae bacterium]
MTTADKAPVEPDPMIDEVRAIRIALSERFDNDVYKLGKYLQEIEAQYPDMFPPAPRPVPTPTSK